MPALSLVFESLQCHKLKMVKRFRACCVPGCNDRISRRFAIPTDEKIRRIFIQRIQNEKLMGYSDLKNRPICKSHFAAFCIEDSGRLRKFSLPTLNLPGYNQPSTEENSFCLPEPEYSFATPQKLKDILKELPTVDDFTAIASTFKDVSPLSQVQRPERVYTRLKKEVFTPLLQSEKPGDNENSFLRHMPPRTSNKQEGPPVIDLAEGDLAPQLVEDFELLQNLPLFDSKLINIGDFRKPLWTPFYFPQMHYEDDILEEPTSRSVNEDNVTSDAIQNNVNTGIGKTEYIHSNEVTVPVERDDKKSLNESSFCIKKPYFKSVKCYMPDCNKFTEVCRICFCSLPKEEEVIKLYGEMEDAIQMKNMLKLVLPDIDLDMYPNTVICTKCTELLAYSYQLKELWLSTEEKLQKILEKKKSVINRNDDLVIVKNEVKSKNSSEIDHDYAGTFTDLKQREDEDPNITYTILRDLLTANKESPENVKVFHGGLNTNSTPAKLVRSRKRISKNLWGLGPYMCEHCGRIFTVSKNLRRHLLSHVYKEKVQKPKERKIMCEICGQLFFSSNVLQRHCRMQHGNPKCSKCGKEFEHIKTLKSHMYRLHLRGSFQCHLCGKQYPYATSLRNHLLLHNPKKRVHACNICDKKYTLPSQLRKHLRVHITERLWNCNYCGKSLKYEYSLQKHIKLNHMNQSEFVCEVCNRPYWKKCDLQKHRIRIHGWGPANKKEQKEQFFENEVDFCSDVQIDSVEYEI